MSFTSTKDKNSKLNVSKNSEIFLSQRTVYKVGFDINYSMFTDTTISSITTLPSQAGNLWWFFCGSSDMTQHDLDLRGHLYAGLPPCCSPPWQCFSPRAIYPGSARVVREIGISAWKPPILMPWRRSERQEMPLVGGFGCLGLCLYGIRELV